MKMRDLFNEYADRIAASGLPTCGGVADELRAWGAWRGSVELADRWAFDTTMLVLSLDEAEDSDTVNRRRAALRVAVRAVNCTPRRVGDEVSAVVDDYWRELARSYRAPGGESSASRAQTAASRRTAWREFCEMTGTRPVRVGERLGPWQRDPDAPHCWLRVREGGDPANVLDRRVFVEKTPRVLRPDSGLSPECCDDLHAWAAGPKGEADDDGDGDGLYGPSREWADAEAEYLGYVLPEDGT